METEGGGVDNRPPIDDNNLPVEAMDTQDGNYSILLCYSSYFVEINVDRVLWKTVRFHNQ